MQLERIDLRLGCASRDRLASRETSRFPNRAACKAGSACLSNRFSRGIPAEPTERAMEELANHLGGLL
jgi:hypothetical protein